MSGFRPRGPVVGVDLDQTLIFSTRSGGLTEQSLVIAEVYEGQASAFMTSRARELLERLAHASELVVVTTRTPEQAARVRLPRSVRHVLCANGGVLLNDGVRDDSHAEWVRSVLDSAPPVSEAWERAGMALHQPWMKLNNKVEDLFCYQVYTDRDAVPASWIAELESWASENRYHFSLQGRKSYLVPRGLTKGAALTRLRDSAPERLPLLAAGDSRLDAEMLNLADHAVRPPHGELARHPELVPSAHEVSSTGFLAGEAVVEWLLETVGSLTR